MAKCNYKVDSTNKERCTRDAIDRRFYCIFHTPESEQRLGSKEYVAELKKLLSEGNGDFRGFIFPEGFHTKGEDIRFEGVDKVDFTGSFFPIGAHFESVTFECDVIFESILAKGSLGFVECDFKGDCSFNFSTFDGEFLCDSEFHEQTFLAGCKFNAQALFTGNFYKHVDFGNSVFHDKTVFRGRLNTKPIIASGTVFTMEQIVQDPKTKILEKGLDLNERLTRLKNNFFQFSSMSWLQVKGFHNKVKTKISNRIKSSSDSVSQWFRYEIMRLSSDSEEIQSLFHSTVTLREVDFRRPERVSFLNVDLSKASLIGTDFTSVQLYDVNWYQPSLGRNGLYEEVELESSHSLFKKRFKRPQLEETYRNIRRNLEAQKDFDRASDFVVGELEQKRLIIHPFLRPFSIVGCYGWLSLYGTRPQRVLLWFLLALSCHLFMTMIISWDNNLSVNALRTLEVFSLQRVEFVNTDQAYVDVAARILSPILIALLTLSIRTKIKRF